MCNKARLLDLIRNFIIFDAGMKKVPRPHQFVGVKAAQERIDKREGGVIWHTQGSGKSILMVLLAKWLLEHDPEARILVVTDRDELDKQIEGVMKNAGVIGAESPSPRITSRAEFVAETRGDHAAAPVRARSTSSTLPTLKVSRRPCTAGSTCSWTNATARRAAT